MKPDPQFMSFLGVPPAAGGKKHNGSLWSPPGLLEFIGFNKHTHTQFIHTSPFLFTAVLRINPVIITTSAPFALQGVPQVGHREGPVPPQNMTAQHTNHAATLRVSGHLVQAHALATSCRRTRVRGHLVHASV
jgi:hypothetical protein